MYIPGCDHYEREIKVGDDVQIFLGFSGNGEKRWSKKAFVVEKIEDHTPVDGPREKLAIVRLSNGQWQHVWNVRVIDRIIEGTNIIPLER